MGVIKVEFDNTLKKSDIIIPLLSPNKNDIDENYEYKNVTDIDQTKVFGIISPLIMINSTVINFDSIQEFNLKSVGNIPTLSMTVLDKQELINNIDKPGVEGEVRIQILPRFENAYKKINLTFYISSIRVYGPVIQLNCSYKVPKLLESKLESFGYINTYNLFRNIALKTQMGFATNIAETIDNRYIYCANNSYLSTLESAISHSNVSNQILDWWIDFWDNINLVDIKERYNSVDTDEDMKLWIAENINDVSADTGEIGAQLVPAILMNHPALNNSELYVINYESKVNSNTLHGTDNIYTVYHNSHKKHSDYLIQNGDIKKDTMITYSYLGENYGNDDYLLAPSIRSNFMRKMNSEVITVTLKTPLLGLMRGHKVNFIRYENNEILENKLKQLESIEVDGQPLIDRRVSSNINLDMYELDDTGENSFKLDRTVSGQYLIIGTEIHYSNNAWQYKLNLVKPLSTKANLLTSDTPNSPQ